MFKTGFSFAWVSGCFFALACSPGGRDFGSPAAGSGGDSAGAPGSSGGRPGQGGASTAGASASGGRLSGAAGDSPQGSSGRTSGEGGTATGGSNDETSGGAGAASTNGGAIGSSGGAGCVASNSAASASCNGGDLWWFDNCGVRTTVKQDCCDQGCTGNACAAPNAHASTQCFSSNEYWVDSCGVQGAQKADCCGMGCANNKCNAPNLMATKVCSNGDSYWVDSCGTQQQLATSCAGNGCEAGACLPACPADMVAIGASHYCIDRYEASVWSAANCSGTAYFKTSGDFPAGFPALVSSAGLSGTVQVAGSSYALSAPTATLYACSKTSVVPAQYINYFQAKRACENSSKRLCTLAEQQNACGSVYPYGSTFDATACNGPGTALVATGSMTRCQGSVPGLYDMSGNALEWAQCDAQNCYRSSMSFQGDANALKCSNSTGTYASEDLVGDGFRCCKDR